MFFKHVCAWHVIYIHFIHIYIHTHIHIYKHTHSFPLKILPPVSLGHLSMSCPCLVPCNKQYVFLHHNVATVAWLCCLLEKQIQIWFCNGGMPIVMGQSLVVTGHDHNGKTVVLSHSLLGSPPSLLLASMEKTQLRFLPISGILTLTLVTSLGLQLLMPELGGQVVGWGV